MGCTDFTSSCIVVTLQKKENLGSQYNTIQMTLQEIQHCVYTDRQ